MRSELGRTRAIGFTSAGLGIAAGAAQLLAGTTVWTGSKNDPISLGIVTILLALIIAVASLTASAPSSTGRALTASVGLGIPALLGLTTAGLVWVPAGVVGVTAAGFALQAARNYGSLRETVGQNWSGILLTALAIIYLALGATALGFTGVVGILGGVAVLASLALRRNTRWGSASLLVVGVLPFAAITISTVVTAVTAILMLLIGFPSILGAPPTRPRAAPAPR